VDAERPALLDRLPEAELVEPRLLAAISTLGHAGRVVAVFRADDLPGADAVSSGVSVALWRVADPGNVGTILRTADALGPAPVGLSVGCADPLGPKALRASAGAVFRVPLVGFMATGGRRIALSAHAGRRLSELDLAGEVTFVLGAEREGLPDDVVHACDEVATIQLAPGAESLNVAVAAAIALYERARRG